MTGEFGGENVTNLEPQPPNPEQIGAGSASDMVGEIRSEFQSGFPAQGGSPFGIGMGSPSPELRRHLRRRIPDVGHGEGRRKQP